MNYILDTNVISELVATQPDVNVTRWIESIDPQSVFLSVITVGELKKASKNYQICNVKPFWKRG